MEKYFPQVFLWFAICWTFLSFIATYNDYLSATHMLRSRKAEFVEGIVTEFAPMPHNGHGTESFVVHGVKFAYSDVIVTAGFNQSTLHGGPMREGLPVRIWHRGTEILRLDVATQN